MKVNRYLMHFSEDGISFYQIGVRKYVNSRGLTKLTNNKINKQPRPQTKSNNK